MSFSLFLKNYSCKHYNRLTNNAFVHQLGQSHAASNFPTDDEIILLYECFFASNKQEKFVLGTYYLFLQDQTTTWKQMLLETNKISDMNSKHGLVIVLLCEWSEKKKPYFYHYLTNQMKIIYSSVVVRSFDILLQKQTNFVFQTNEHALRKELAIGTVKSLTLMEMKNYMSHTRCVQLTWRCTNKQTNYVKIQKSIPNTTQNFSTNQVLCNHKFYCILHYILIHLLQKKKLTKSKTLNYITFTLIVIQHLYNYFNIKLI